MNAIAETTRREIDERQRRHRHDRQNRIGHKENRSNCENLNYVRERDRNHHDESLNLHHVT